MIIVKVEMADSGQFTCLAENIAGEARSTADLVIRPAGSEPGSYFHVTKVIFAFCRISDHRNFKCSCLDGKLKKEFRIFVQVQN